MTVSVWEGELVRLRAVEEDDWEAYRRDEQDSDAARHGYFIPLPTGGPSARRWVSDQAARRPDDASDDWRFAIETLDGVLVGSIQAHHCDRRHGTFEYGLGIFRDHWGRGYAGDAVRVLLRHYFGELRYQKCNVGVFSFNDRSLRLHEKLGFVAEGRRRRTIYTHSEYHDDVLFGITAEEFWDRDRRA